jgi:hypothetical protein
MNIVSHNLANDNSILKLAYHPSEPSNSTERSTTVCGMDQKNISQSVKPTNKQRRNENRPIKHVLQFNWSRHWKKLVEPHLKHELVQTSLDLGMMMYDFSWKRGDPPHLYGRFYDGRIIEGKLSWYQPWGRCHWIAFFSMAIGVINYPDLDWRFLTGELHTVPVGFDATGEPKVVMDILLFRHKSAEESIEQTRRKAPCRAAIGEPDEEWKKTYAAFIEQIVPMIRTYAKHRQEAARLQ